MLLFIITLVIYMKIYLDYIFLINFLFDFILLLGVSLFLKRSVSKLRLLLGSLFGGVSFFIIFFDVGSVLFFFFKMIMAIIMIIITFSFKDLKYTLNNFISLIILSVLMGGVLFLINIEIGYSHVGMMFFTNGNSLNLIILVLLGILITVLYSRYMGFFKINNSTYYKVILSFGDVSWNLNGFMDTGNTLYYKNSPVVILNKNFENKINSDLTIFVPYKTVSGSGVMKGFKCCSLSVLGYGTYKNVVVCLSNDKFHLGGSDIILNTNLKEDL